MNKHVLLVMRWLKDKDSVSKEELARNSLEAWDYAADAAYCDVASAAATSAAVAYAAASHAADAYDTSSAIYATRWVDKYFELTSEDRDDYRLIRVCKAVELIDGECYQFTDHFGNGRKGFFVAENDRLYCHAGVIADPSRCTNIKLLVVGEQNESN